MSTKLSQYGGNAKIANLISTGLINSANGEIDNYNLCDLSHPGGLYIQLGRNDQSGSESILQLADGTQSYSYPSRPRPFFQVSLDAATTVFDVDSHFAASAAEVTVSGYLGTILYLNGSNPDIPTDIEIKVDGAAGVQADPANRKGRSLKITAEPGDVGGTGGSIHLIGGSGDTAQGNINLNGDSVLVSNTLSVSGDFTLAGTFNSNGLLILSGGLQAPPAIDAPVNTATPAGWINISINGTPAWLPYYQ